LIHNAFFFSGFFFVVVPKLSLKSALRNPKYGALVLLVSIVTAVTVYFLLTRIDLIVHGKLYYFGLVFSPEWADLYRTYMWSIYACIVMPMALSGAVLAYGLLENRKSSDKLQGFEIIQKVDIEPLEWQVWAEEA